MADGWLTRELLAEQKRLDRLDRAIDFLRFFFARAYAIKRSAHRAPATPFAPGSEYVLFPDFWRSSWLDPNKPIVKSKWERRK